MKLPTSVLRFLPLAWVCGFPAPLTANETDLLTPLETPRSADISTQFLFDPHSRGTVEDLFLSHSTSTLFGQNRGRSYGQYFQQLSDEQQQKIVDRAFPLDAAIWDSANILVCWEETENAFAEEREFVKKAIVDTWQSASALEFQGWNQCKEHSENSTGIRITLQDEGPHVKKLGKLVSGEKNGMVLNFTYENWEPKCGSSKKHWDICTRMTAVHEFGHAIGFAHEQNRTDTPNDCGGRKLAAGTVGDNENLTPWDLASVMNYCNAKNMNNGVLSKFDKLAVQKKYGVA